VNEVDDGIVLEGGISVYEMVYPSVPVPVT
jgi:hypothetical protein